MTTPNRPPIPSGGTPTGLPGLTDPDTGRPVSVADLRSEFARLSHQTTRDPKAERAFIENKIEMIRKDSNLTESEKERAIEGLRRAL